MQNHLRLKPVNPVQVSNKKRFHCKKCPGASAFRNSAQTASSELQVIHLDLKALQWEFKRIVQVLGVACQVA